jgi:hypothetical protein
MADSSTPTRQFQPAGVGVLQSIHDVKYATRILAAGTIPGTTNFFGAAPSADLTLDRYDQGNTLVASGKTYTIYQLAVHVFKNTADANLADIQKIVDNCFIQIQTAAKEFGVYPIGMLPYGGGICVQGGNIAVTPAAAPGGITSMGVTNGHPLRKRFALKHPLVIQSNQPFFINMLAPTATPLTLASITIVRIELEGVEERAAS